MHVVCQLIGQVSSMANMRALLREATGTRRSTCTAANSVDGQQLLLLTKSGIKVILAPVIPKCSIMPVYNYHCEHQWQQYHWSLTLGTAN